MTRIEVCIGNGLRTFTKIKGEKMFKLFVAEKRGKVVDVKYFVKPEDIKSLEEDLTKKDYSCYVYKFKTIDALNEYLEGDIKMVKMSGNTYKVEKPF
jgi:hypothetical protein